MNLDVPIIELGRFDLELKVLNTSHFIQDTWRQEEYPTHAQTECIFLRHWKNKDIDALEMQDYPLLSVYKSALDKILDQLKQHYDYVDYAAIITNLKAGASIPLHTDGGEIFEISRRIHIPLKTNEQVVFHCGELSINMKQGYAYEIGNSSHRHGVDNNSNEDRYHLIVDLIT